MSLRETIKALYEADCCGATGSKKCNCFLHSYTSRDEKGFVDPIDDFDKLTPFIEYVDLVHDSYLELTLVKLKEYARSFDFPALSFRDAKW